MTIKERVKGRTIGIIGMARSGLAAAGLIKSMGGRPFVSDIKSESLLIPEIKQLQTAGIDYEIGGHTDKLLSSEFVILSPGVPRSSEIVQKILQRGIPVFSEIELASWFCRGRIIAVTGSNGKTTTTTLIGAILTQAGLDNWVCGNIGYPFAEAVADIPDDGYAVVELSSFQLESIEDFAPHISLILNITPDHLDRYDGFDSYKRAKYRIAGAQGDNDFLILNADDPVTDKSEISSAAEKINFSISRDLPTGVFKRGESLVGLVDGKEYNIIDVNRIRIPGPHNLMNAAAASLTALLLGVPPEAIEETLSRFPGVEHRLEDVATVAGIRFINDSKATNIDSVHYALKSFDAPICLIAGGRDKGADFAPIIRYGRGKIKEIILIGEAREKMFESLGKTFPVQFADSMEDAVKKAFAAASPGEIVLLSPACASFDMYDDFEHRGRVFKQAVHDLNGKNSLAGDFEKK
jgi:UDP-N-acetylmuramoylalanine--D-glutamate ligase